MTGMALGRFFWERAVLCCLVGLACMMAAPAQAKPLTFGAIDGANELTASSQLTGCAAVDNGSACRLNRTNFGGLPIDRSEVMLNPMGRVRSLDILLDAGDYDVARRLLIGRYGPPSAASADQWLGFDDGARIAISRSKRNTLVSFLYPANISSSGSAAPDSGVIIQVLLFVVLGLAAGLLFRRWRNSRPAEPAMSPREPSMRATLERRLAQGDDLGF